MFKGPKYQRGIIGMAAAGTMSRQKTLTTSGPPQPDYTNVIFLANFDGADEDISYTTEDQYERALTPIGSIKLDDEHVKFGTTSSYHNGGNSDWGVNDNGEIGSAISATSFCMECWYFPQVDVLTHGENGHNIISSWNQLFNERQFMFGVADSGEVEFLYSTDGTNNTALESTGAGLGGLGTAEGWRHVAVSYDHDVQILRMFSSGSMVYEESMTDTIHVSTGGSSDCQVGLVASGVGQRRQMVGWLDDLRITVGEPVYTADFDVPTEAHPTA